MNQSSPSAGRPPALLIVLSGPSGVGKGSILSRALPRLPGVVPSVSVTTREKRPGEKEGEDYLFRSEDEFKSMVEAGEFMEWANYLCASYGTPRRWVEERLREGVSVVLEIDIQGARQVKDICRDAVLIFVAPPSWDELARRLRERHTEAEEVLEKRLMAAREELRAAMGSGDGSMFDYIIVNDDLEAAAGAFRCIVEAERRRPGRVDLSFLADCEEGADV